jgi:hypothetical protein
MKKKTDYEEERQKLIFSLDYVGKELSFHHHPFFL